MEMVRVALVGCGRISAKHVNALEECKDVKIVAVCDIRHGRAQILAAKLGCNCYFDHLELLEKEGFDLIDICTPNDTHPQIAIDAARKGKHVLTEKPMALSVEDCDRMIGECEKNNVRLFVVKQNRFNPPIMKTREALERGRFGKLFLGNVTVRWARPQEYYDGNEWHGTKDRDGGMLFTQASHHVDMLQWMLGPVSSVKAYAGTLTHDIETEDNAVVALKFMSGALGVIESSTSIFPRNMEGSLTLLGEKGSVKVGGMAMNKIDHWEFSDFENDDEHIKDCATTPPNVYGFGHNEVVRSVVDSLKGNKIAWEVDGHEGKKSVKLIRAIYESAETGREIFLD
ncbi:MAG: Gfo/Idh/MocA family oxidoreductase [archaeon]